MRRANASSANERRDDPGHRHGEWLEWDLPSSQKFPRGVTFGGEEIIHIPGGAAAVWGVSAVPPGTSKEEGDVYRSMNDQQSR